MNDMNSTIYCSGSNRLPSLEEPVRVAVIGAGNRAWTVYRSVLSLLKPWVEVVAVCDPVTEHADRLGQDMNVPVFYTIHDLVRSRPIEAAFILSPIESHYAYSVYLSSHGIHNLVETMFCNLYAQAEKMIAAAQEHHSVVRVADNFFRFPVDRFAQTLRDSGYLGRIGRIVSYSDFTGYHNNARWIKFAQAYPVWAQSIRHEMATPPHRSFPHRVHQSDPFSARFFGFADGFLISDQAANIKGLLGRHPRPGYTEWQGDQGTLVYQAKWPAKELQFNALYPFFANMQNRADDMLGRAEVRCCSPVETPGCDGEISGIATEYAEVSCEYEHNVWSKISARTEQGQIEYLNTMLPASDMTDPLPTDSDSVMEVIADFALAVRGVRDSELTDEDALMSVMMEMATQESALNNGKRLNLPLENELEADHLEAQRLKKLYGVDPFDVDAMIAVQYARP
jgi:hypothetical protein